MNYQERLFRMRQGFECDGASWAYLAALAISAASTATSIQAQGYAADADAEYQRNLTEANNTVAAQQAAQLRMQQAQEREAAAREIEKGRLATQGARSSAIVAAGEAGVSGLSVDALLHEHGMHFGQFKEATNRQSQVSESATNSQLEAIRTGARFQNLQINAPIAQPNRGAAFVRFGSDALGATREYRPAWFTGNPRKPAAPPSGR